ncbi:hypothetical protein [Halopelagius longus]|uniref:Uncharacterized protein n=1 Tax=Halopelagius longus TaxID=1236180 RepID=A0A1H1AW39_9EURY|nr:hypothetical protein [Halopelagius longus]SDQ43897.1 hypothetical protein SAMN05216278_1517 [Halopelagius longus]
MFEGITQARKRDGNPSENRPKEVEEAIPPIPELGYNQGLPLVGDDYDDYPQGDSLLQPTAGDKLRELADNELINTEEDLADEIGTNADRIGKAVKLHGIQLPDEGSFDIEVSRETISLPFEEDIPLENLREPVFEDARILHHLYVDCGMGTNEIADYLTKELKATLDGPKRVWNVKPAEVRQALIEVGFIDGERSKGTTKTVEEDDLQFGGPTVTIEEPRRKAR